MGRSWGGEVSARVDSVLDEGRGGCPCAVRVLVGWTGGVQWLGVTVDWGVR